MQLALTAQRSSKKGLQNYLCIFQFYKQAIEEDGAATMTG